jgi:DmsE family decaheme c-type cytochrome
MIRAENINQLCYKCHADKRGPYLWEHPPVEENCLTCHVSHGSKTAKLMTEKVPNLCQDCHDASRHPGTVYDAKTGFTGSAPSNRFFARSCLNCHSSIHGGYAPTNPDNGYNSGQDFVR